MIKANKNKTSKKLATQLSVFYFNQASFGPSYVLIVKFSVVDFVCKVLSGRLYQLFVMSILLKLDL